MDYPVLILSSAAGGGNHSVGEALQERLNAGGSVNHRTIEGLLSPTLCHKHFDRYATICYRAPWLLYIIYNFPISYLWELLKGLWGSLRGLDHLRDEIIRSRVRTVICTNHRACFFVSLLKLRRKIDVRLEAVLTDYWMSAGWRLLYWNEIDHFSGPIEKDIVPQKYREKYQRWDFPLKIEFQEAAKIEGNPKDVLISGGGWGLGFIDQTVAQVSSQFPALRLYVACGKNRELYERLRRQYPGKTNIVVLSEQPSLISWMKRCASLITKPGGTILSEAVAMKRKIFLIKGLPVVEEKNSDYAIRNFGALMFSVTNFKTWLEGQVF
jgi:UDP-N-acetylglucosamine:LPS N-acetylglucosamine transferase